MIDVTWTLSHLLPSPQFGGCIEYEFRNEDGTFTAATEEQVQAQYESLRWEDVRTKPTWQELLDAWPSAQLTMVPTNTTLEQAFLQLLPKHLGQPYLTDAVIFDVMKAKTSVVEANNIDTTGTLAKAIIRAVPLPSEMESDRSEILSLVP